MTSRIDAGYFSARGAERRLFEQVPVIQQRP
jgi:hypothetical protein